MQLDRNRPIGVFDSGVGGLTVVRKIRQVLPFEDVIYFGDTARVPYGNKSPRTVTRFVSEIMAFMAKSKVKMVVAACNTASSLSLSSLKNACSVPVVGVITSGIKEAVRVSRNGKIGLIGTSSTVSSRAYEKALAKTGAACRLFSKACPLFVPLVENRIINDEVTRKMAERYLRPLKTKQVDTLILGCTHYPVLKGVIRKVMGNTRLIDSSSAVAGQVRETLLDQGLAARGRKRRGRIKYYVSDDTEAFCAAAGIFMKEKIEARKVIL